MLQLVCFNSVKVQINVLLLLFLKCVEPPPTCGLMQSRWKTPELRLFGRAQHNFLSLSVSIVVSALISFGIKLICFSSYINTLLSLSQRHINTCKHVIVCMSAIPYCYHSDTSADLALFYTCYINILVAFMAKRDTSIYQKLQYNVAAMIF